MQMEKVLRKAAISKRELHRRLRQFIIDSAADDAADPIIGPRELVGGNLGVTPWVHVIQAGCLFCLHADVRRSAVVQYLKLVDRFGDDLAWTVVRNQRGRENAVAYGPEAERVTPFYNYLVKPLDVSTSASV